MNWQVDPASSQSGWSMPGIVPSHVPYGSLGAPAVPPAPEPPASPAPARPPSPPASLPPFPSAPPVPEAPLAPAPVPAVPALPDAPPAPLPDPALPPLPPLPDPELPPPPTAPPPPPPTLVPAMPPPPVPAPPIGSVCSSRAHPATASHVAVTATNVRTASRRPSSDRVATTTISPLGKLTARNHWVKRARSLSRPRPRAARSSPRYLNPLRGRRRH